MRQIAEAKRKKNIVEYILFMWQIEDLIRGCEFDPEQLKALADTGGDPQEIQQSTDWLLQLSADMQEQDLLESGHHSASTEAVLELLFVQNSLLTVHEDETFRELYQKVQPLLTEFKAKSKDKAQNDVETALTALYGVALLRLQQKSISPETQKALSEFTSYLNALATAHRQMHSGTGKFSLN